MTKERIITDEPEIISIHIIFHDTYIGRLMGAAAIDCVLLIDTVTALSF